MSSDTPVTPPREPLANPVTLQLTVDGPNRVVQVQAMRKLDLAPMQFGLSFAMVKSLAARILDHEVAQEQQQQRPIVRPT